MKRAIIPVVLVLMGVCLMGCGKTLQGSDLQKDNWQFAGSPGLEKDPMEAVRAFDSKLEAMRTKEDAKIVIAGFVDAVSGGMKEGGVSTMSTAEADAKNTVIDRLAEDEILCRNNDMRLSAAAVKSRYVTPRKIVDAISRIAGVPVNKDRIIKKVRSAMKDLRELMPHIAVSKGEDMSPLEAMMATYAVYAVQNSPAGPVTLSVPQEKALEFARKISE